MYRHIVHLCIIALIVIKKDFVSVNILMTTVEMFKRIHDTTKVIYNSTYDE